MTKYLYLQNISSVEQPHREVGTTEGSLDSFRLNQVLQQKRQSAHSLNQE